MQTRRKFVANGLGLLLAPALPALAGALTPTPRQTAGPFYPQELPLDDDNDLTRVAGAKSMARGQITDLTGRLVDKSGRPVAGTRIEIWQCDANGRYHHPRDRGNRPRDPGFQGHGHNISDADGRYRFRTIHPVPYPGRTPHIHVAVFPAGQEPFVTQLYVAGEPQNADDMLYRRIPVEHRPLVTAEFKPTRSLRSQFSVDWDLILGVGTSGSTPT